jgi:beta-glucosidase
MVDWASAPSDFLWATGVENTFIPQTKPGHRALDEYELMGHYDHWREDLAVARDLGFKAMRWGLPWYRVEPERGKYDWSWTDEVLPYLVEELGIRPIVDLMHYGCPFWLRREFASDEYTDAVSEYAAAVSSRYSGLVTWYTPLNEPLVNALMCGKRGLWPPYLRGDRGYVRIMLQLAKGIQNTVRAIKENSPGAIMVDVEATGLSRAARQDLEVLAVEEQRRGYLCYDLLTGKVTPDHPLFSWLVRNGASPDNLATFVASPRSIDIIGMNFYPQWSRKQLYVDKKGMLASRSVVEDGDGFAGLIRDYHQRYQVPIIVTETSAYGSDETRAEWLDASLAAVKQLRSEGVPVLGYTWFPLFTMIDWRYRYGRGPVEQYSIELGLYRLNWGSDNGRWRSTSLVERFRNYINNPVEAVGALASHPIA